MLAEIYGKVNRQNTNLTELGEDELTGNFFGCLRYLPFDKGMKKILKNAIRPVELQSMVDEIDNQYWNENILFWKKERENGKTTELDIRIDFDSIVIGIEVKYRSGLSSEDDASNADTVSAENSVNQLSKEARILNSVGKNKHKLLLLLADEVSCVDIINNGHIKIIEDVPLGYISWQEVLLQLKNLENLNEYEQLIVSDLINLLEKKDFLRFQDFKITSPNVNCSEYWFFEQPKQDIKFSFCIDKTVEESYYEFR